MTTALVIGNGESRKNINIPEFARGYDTIGCNAIHRDGAVDYIVCCDRRMVEEAVKSENTKYTEIHVRPDWFHYFRKIRKDRRIKQVPKLPYQGEQKQDQPLHWGSGPYAVLLAATQEHETVMMIGFDLYPSNDKVNNLYKGTPNYSKEDANPVDPSYWVYQISKVFQYYPETDFVIWNHSDWTMPKLWQRKNVRFESFTKDNH